MMRTNGFNQSKITEQAATMSAKKKSSLADTVHDAATGYATVVLGVICFLIVLVVVIAGVRVLVGGKLATAANTQTAAIATNSVTRVA